MIEEGKVIKQRHRAPSIKQVKAVQLINQGYSKRRAMIEAGYSVNVANHPDKLMKSAGVKTILEAMKSELLDAGLTGQYMAKKFGEWFKATKIHSSPTEPDIKVPDNDIQIKAYDRWEKIMALGQGNKGVKRKVTFEEFVDE